ncbi:MAG: 1-(5-phosphoribosyl)-5-[(5-phosphoribosylamino)methylideneamino]imidazole-4-carboxamide isomerase [Proteobacteria bacterium]|nr:1-(5-phosphoribosyl)-5-[(5-phosphoribosylamino)methylideneamino]imidazole-4-carboxamide isomerase [Pseudomonadota bacterium]MDA0994589.1 1-(5-phosphoribosyl)-5-[(5-phosphoribosylamino)methylideneamino]imidazole-4-carboxamide isomerase [Pseudomonadota bacterium]
MNIIPAIDLREGRCVRLRQGDFERQTTYTSDPVSIALEYQAMGLQKLHVVDLDGAKAGRQQNQETIAAIVGAATSAIQLGGGIRDESEIRTWLDAGVERVVVGSLAVEEPQTVKTWLRIFGVARIVLALDVRLDKSGIPLLATHGWVRTTEKSLSSIIDTYLPAGALQILCTDISRDGAMAGPNLPLYKDLAARYPNVFLQASGGVRSIEDIEALRATGVDDAICGRALLDSKITAVEVEKFLRVA